MIDYCDIYLMIYLEEQGYVKIAGALLIAERVSYDTGEVAFQRFTELPQFRTGIFKLVPHGEGSDR